MSALSAIPLNVATPVLELMVAVWLAIDTPPVVKVAVTTSPIPVTGRFDESSIVIWGCGESAAPLATLVWSVLVSARWVAAVAPAGA
ncbi:MAG: hypothetical protein KGJ36_01470 [Acidobacteriota bacterium]|nr:hypothetical protein [Acidobacteriota bacterium]